MKLTCVGLGPARCLILRLRKANILLDCGLWDGAWCGGVGSVRAFPAPLDAQYLTPLLELLSLHELDAALISNAQAALALPILLAQQPHAIRGPIYVTLAALDIAQHLASELSAASAATSRVSGATEGAAAEEAGHALQDAAAMLGVSGTQQLALLARCWRDAHVQWEVLGEGCSGASHITTVRYGQEVSLDSYSLTARAYPSGSEMGSALWVLHDGCRSVGYLGSFLPPPPPLSAAHPLQPLLPTALELQPPTLEGLTSLIIAPHTCTAHSSMGRSSPTDPGPAVQPLGVLLDAVCSTVRAGAPVLLPLPATGIAWGIIESMCGALEQCGLAHVPVILAGPVARDSLALANTSMDFVSRPRQARAYIPEPCFAVEHLVASRRLIVTHDLTTPPPPAPPPLPTPGTGSLNTAQPQHGTQPQPQTQPVVSPHACVSSPQAPPLPPGPCVVIAPPASFAARGLAHRLVQVWGSNPHATLILTHAATGCIPGSTAAAAAALSAAHPRLRMRIVQCALGSSPPATQLAALLAGLQRPPCHVLAWHEEASALAAEVARFMHKPQGSSAQGGAGAAVEVVGYRWLDVVSVKLPKHVAEVGVSPVALGSVAWQPATRQATVSQAAADIVAGRLTAVLNMKEGKWQVDSLPSLGPHPASTATTALASAALYARSGLGSGLGQEGEGTGQLQYGRPSLQATLDSLKARGLVQVQVHNGDGVAGAAGHESGSPWAVSVEEVGGEIRVDGDTAIVSAPTVSARKLLGECLSAQLTVL